MASKQPTLATIDKKIDALAKGVDLKIDALAKSVDKRFDAVAENIEALTKTVENLAIATKKGFDDTVTKKELGKVTERLDAVETRLEEVEKTTSRIENNLTNRMERVEDTVQVLKTHVGVR